MKRFCVETVMAAIFTMLFAGVVFAQDHLITLGNAVGEVSNVDGPAWIQVDMNGCQFFMKIDRGDHVKYNGPDFIFYRSNYLAADRDLPYLKQAEMSAGYDWWFEDPKDKKIPWVGLMCESISSFKWSSDPVKTDMSPELQDVMDSNLLKCPADFDGEKWVVRQGVSGARFINLDVIGGVGFVIGDKMKNGGQGSRFCFVNGRNVLIGISGGGIGIGEDKGAGDSIIGVLKGIEFKSGGIPIGWPGD